MASLPFVTAPCCSCAQQRAVRNLAMASLPLAATPHVVRTAGWECVATLAIHEYIGESALRGLSPLQVHLTMLELRRQAS